MFDVRENFVQWLPGLNVHPRRASTWRNDAVRLVHRPTHLYEEPVQCIQANNSISRRFNDSMTRASDILRMLVRVCPNVGAPSCGDRWRCVVTGASWS